jgi:hypothetical protein
MKPLLAPIFMLALWAILQPAQLSAKGHKHHGQQDPLPCACDCTAQTDIICDEDVCTVSYPPENWTCQFGTQPATSCDPADDYCVASPIILDCACPTPDPIMCFMGSCTGGNGD